jgi:hypothetical protein
MDLLSVCLNERLIIAGLLRSITEYIDEQKFVTLCQVYIILFI